MISPKHSVLTKATSRPQWLYTVTNMYLISDGNPYDHILLTSMMEARPSLLIFSTRNNLIDVWLSSESIFTRMICGDEENYHSLSRRGGVPLRLWVELCITRRRPCIKMFKYKIQCHFNSTETTSLYVIIYNSF